MSRPRKAPQLVALAATLALVIQMIAAGLTNAVAAPARDVFGNPTCTARSDDAGEPPAQQPDHRHLADCCLAGCVAGSALLPAMPAALSRDGPAGLADMLPPPVIVADAFRDGSPLLPRAPPWAH